MKSWGNHLSEIPSCVIIYSICREHHRHDFLSEFLHEYIFNAALGTFAFSYQNVVLQFWISVPNKAVIFEKSAFSDWYCLYYPFGVRSWTHGSGVILHLQIHVLNQDPQILLLHIIWNKYPKRYFSIQNLTIQAFIPTSISFQVKYCNAVLPTPKICDLQESTKTWKTFSLWVNYFILKVVKPRGLFIITLYVACVIAKTDNEKNVCSSSKLMQSKVKRIWKSTYTLNMIKIIH